MEGLQRAITFEGLMLISKASIMPGLSMPGRLGSVVAAAFGYYERVLEYKGKIRPSAVAVDADALMMRVWESAPALTDPLAARSKEPKPGTRYKKILGTTVLMLAAASTWALVFFLR